MQNLPVLATQETQRLRSDYPSIEHLEAGNVACVADGTTGATFS
jgi:hypothetical protein